MRPAERAELDRLLTAQTDGKLTFYEFVCRVRPSYRWYRHCRILADVLQRVADGQIKRLMVFMPPRHGKSELISRLFSAYFLYRYPHRWVAVASYAADLAYTLSRASQENYVAAGAPLKGNAHAVKHWETGEGGGFWAAGVGGPATGKGWHLGIVDDPLKNNEQAASDTIREKQKEWYGSTWSTREEPWSDDDPEGAEILVQTRWHEDDLSGWRLAEEMLAFAEDDGEPERWHVVNFPAIKEETDQVFPPTCTVEPDWRRPGEALCPERRPLDKLRKIAKRIGDYFFGALYQQRPTAKDGTLFKVGQFGFVDAAPAGLRLVRAWDVAATEGAGAFTAGVLMGTPKDKAHPDHGVFFILDVVRRQWGTSERDKNIRLTAETDGTQVRIRGPQDPGAAGVDAAAAFVRNLAGFRVATVRVTGDKETRADPFSSQVNAGNVRLVRGPWNKAFVDEHRSFPNGTYKDQVDAAADAFSELTRPPETPAHTSHYGRSSTGWRR